VDPVPDPLLFFGAYNDDELSQNIIQWVPRATFREDKAAGSKHFYLLPRWRSKNAAVLRLRVIDLVLDVLLCF
jgi:hypothetical protein